MVTQVLSDSSAILNIRIGNLYLRPLLRVNCEATHHIHFLLVHSVHHRSDFLTGAVNFYRSLTQTNGLLLGTVFAEVTDPE